MGGSTSVERGADVVLGEDLHALWPFVENLAVERIDDETYECRGPLADDQVLPMARALLRAQAEVLTHDEAADVIRDHHMPKAFTHMVLKVLAARVSRQLV